MIQVYPIEIEAVDENHDPMFKLRAFDESCATLTFDGAIGPDNIDDVCAALQLAVELLELKGKPEPETAA